MLPNASVKPSRENELLGTLPVPLTTCTHVHQDLCAQCLKYMHHRLNVIYRYVMDLNMLAREY
ncbi:hypothetical protein XarzCFBP7410_07575 [Xanthomonas arboricola pv. zantedeschiae]|nr:hypothetical protein XarzCFBP7410_07575 [Xanthomonas arboricola pv. zantedeschiae]